jgi:hypothetical protein
MSTIKYRITDDVLLSINTTDPTRVDFHKANFVNQWLLASEIDKVVWAAGTYAQTLNKVAGNTDYIPINDSSLSTDNEIIFSGNMLIRQGFSWNNIFGILLIIRGMETGNVLTSRIWQMSDMLITENSDIQLINGAFFPYSVPFTLPNKSNESLMASIVYVTYDNIDSSGFISNYPTNVQYFTPLNASAPLPDYIVANITFDNNQYIIITPATLESTITLEQSILNYFGFSNNVVPIQINYILTYGNDAIGYKNILVSNQDNVFNAIKLGLDFTPWADSGLITILVTMQITCNDVLLTIQQNVIFDLQDNIAPFINAVVATQNLTVYPITLQTQNVITNTVIETTETVKVIPVIQPVFVEMQSKNDILFQSKLIMFPQVTKPSTMQISPSTVSAQQFVLSQVTLDGTTYFDLSQSIQPISGTPYIVIDNVSRLIVTQGLIN